MQLCQYKHIFGVEQQGVHSIRVLNIAVVDLILTIIAAVLISKWLSKKFTHVLGVLIIIGIILHRLFCVNTTINKFLFGTV